MEFLIPSRRERPGDDPIFSLAAEAKQRLAAGEDIVNATIGALLHDDGRLAVMPSIVEALSSVDSARAAAYAPIPGPADFRKAVRHDLLADAGLEDIAANVATPGGSGALRMTIDDFSEPGQKVLSSSFFWGPYKTLCDESGRVFDTFNMFNAEGRFDAEALDKKLGEVLAEQGRALVIFNSPCHNPTGYSLDGDEWQAVADVLVKHACSGPVVAMLDIAYSYYAKEGLTNAIRTLKSIMDKVLVLFAWSASKSFTQYGLRVGSLVAVVPDDEQRGRIDNALTFSCRGLWSNCNARGMAAITRALTDPELHKRTVEERGQLVKLLARRVECWNELAGKTSIRYPRYTGGFFTTVFCDDAYGAAKTLRERGVFVVPMPGALRVAMCAVNEGQIARIVDEMVKALG